MVSSAVPPAHRRVASLILRGCKIQPFDVLFHPDRLAPPVSDRGGQRSTRLPSQRRVAARARAAVARVELHLGDKSLQAQICRIFSPSTLDFRI